MSSDSSPKFEQGVAGVERSEPPVRRASGGSSTNASRRSPSTPATRRLLNPILWLPALIAALALGNVCRAEDSVAQQRRQRLENMTREEKIQLDRDNEWFMGLEEAERAPLEQLHAQLEKAPELRTVMHAYCRWMKSLPTYTRDELRALEPKERVRRIKELRAQELKQVNPADLAGLGRWMRQYAADPKHEAQILKAATEEHKRDFLARAPAVRKWLTAETLQEQMFRPVPSSWKGWPDYFGRPDWLTDDVLASLHKHLPDRSRGRLEKMTPARQFTVINGWFQRATEGGLSRRWFSGGPPPEQLQAQVADFFQHELTPQQKSDLLYLPPDEMQRELRRMYFMRHGLMSRSGRGRGFDQPPNRSSDPEGGPRNPGSGS